MAQVRRGFVGEPVHSVDRTGPGDLRRRCGLAGSWAADRALMSALRPRGGDMEQQERTTQPSGAGQLGADDIVAVALSVIDSATQAWACEREPMTSSTSSHMGDRGT